MSTISEHTSSVSQQVARSAKPHSTTSRTTIGGPENQANTSLSFQTTDTFSPGSESGLQDLNDIIAKNKALRNLSSGSSPMLFGGPTEQKKKNPVRRAFDWYVKNVDVPGPYGSPKPDEWTKPGEVTNIGGWNDQVGYVSKNGTTAEKFLQRGALATGVAATSVAVATGLAELKLGKQILVDGPKSRGGRIFQLRPKGESGFFRLDYHALGKHSPKGFEGVRLPHYHRAPNMGLHRPFQGF